MKCRGLMAIYKGIAADLRRSAYSGFTGGVRLRSAYSGFTKGLRRTCGGRLIADLQRVCGCGRCLCICRFPCNRKAGFNIWRRVLQMCRFFIYFRVMLLTACRLGGANCSLGEKNTLLFIFLWYQFFALSQGRICQSAV